MKSEDARFEDAVAQILRWYRDETGRFQLSDSLHGRLQRWKLAREFMLTYRPLTDSYVVAYLMKDCNVSEPQAWRDVRDTKRFFASHDTVNREYERKMLIAQIQNLRTIALNTNQLKVAAQCDATLAKLGLFNQPDADQPIATKNIELVVGFNPALAGAKEIPNLLEQVEQFIGERAKRELMMGDWIDNNGNKLN